MGKKVDDELEWGMDQGTDRNDHLTFFNEIFWILYEEESHKNCEEAWPD